MPEKEQDFVTIYIASLDQRVKLLTSREDTFTSMLADEREKLQSSSDVELTGQAMRDQIDRTKRLFELPVQRLGAITLDEIAGAYTMEVINTSSRARQAAPDLDRFMTTGSIIGLFVGLALAFIREKVDNRFLAPEDIHAQLGVPVIGHVADMPRSIRNAKHSGSLIDSTVVAHHRPQSHHAECYRAVRVALYFNTQANGHRVIQVTSPSPGDGKSTLACNLAVSIANSNKSVLLVDADLSRPRVHKIFGLGNEQGFVQVIRRQAERADVLKGSGMDGLGCLVCGRRPSDPAELLTSAIFERFLDVVRDMNDYLILDSPLQLAVTDPSVVAARVDAVFLTIRLKRNARASATRAAEILGSIGATLVGLVVNGAGAKKSYGYGKYGRYGPFRMGHFSVWRPCHVRP